MKTSRALIAVLVAMTLVMVALVVTLALVLTRDDEGDAEANAEHTPSTASSSPAVAPIERAINRCSTGETGETILAGDDNQTIIINTVNQFGSTDGLLCVLNSLKTSEAIRAQIDATTSLMGMQTAEQDGLSYQWSYHPDNGVNMTITEQ